MFHLRLNIISHLSPSWPTIVNTMVEILSLRKIGQGNSVSSPLVFHLPTPTLVSRHCGRLHSHHPFFPHFINNRTSQTIANLAIMCNLKHWNMLPCIACQITLKSGLMGGSAIFFKKKNACPPFLPVLWEQNF